ncbi:hypothetical protein V6Z12_D08G107900 [Gossypium hirsutum]
MYSGEDLPPVRYTDSGFQMCRDLRKSILGCAFVLGSGSIVWRSAKQSCIADSTIEVEYVVASKSTKEAIWLRKFLTDLEVIISMEKAITLYCDNSAVIANTKETRNHKRTKYFDRNYM